MNCGGVIKGSGWGNSGGHCYRFDEKERKKGVLVLIVVLVFVFVYVKVRRSFECLNRVQYRREIWLRNGYSFLYVIKN